MPVDHAKAKKLAQEAHDGRFGSEYLERELVVAAAYIEVVQRLAEVEAQTIERCAKECDEMVEPKLDNECCVASMRSCAAAILALNRTAAAPSNGNVGERGWSKQLSDEFNAAAPTTTEGLDVPQSLKGQAS